MRVRDVRRALLVVLGLGISMAGYFSYTVGVSTGRLAAIGDAHADAPIVLKLEHWHTKHVPAELRVVRIDGEAQRALAEMQRRIARIQARIVQLDTLADRFVDDNGLLASQFDFGAAPALGGPEQQPLPELAGDIAPRSTELRVALARLSSTLDDRWIQLHALEDALDARSLAERVLPDGRPVARAYISSYFGERVDPFTGQAALHEGVDFAGPHGTRIVAVGSGIVTAAGPRFGYGRMIEIDHGSGLLTRYAHNAENLVAVGDVVTRGQTIARLGATGRATGPNLHFEVWREGRAVDPLAYTE